MSEDTGFFHYTPIHHLMAQPSHLNFAAPLPAAISVHETKSEPCAVGVAFTASIPDVTPSGGAGCNQHSYFYDYYFRIHTIPNPVNFGIIASTKTNIFSIFNSYDTDVVITAKHLEDLNEFLDGVSVSGLETLPITIPSLGTLQLSATALITANNPEFDGKYVLAIDQMDISGAVVLKTLSADIDLVGARSTLYAFSPYNKIGYTIEFKTRIAESMRGEQRASVLSKPYETVNYKYRMKASHTYSTIIAERRDSGLPFTVPMWFDYIPFSSVTSGVTELWFDTSQSTFSAGDNVMLWESDIKSEVIGIAEVKADHIVLDTIVSFDYEFCYVMPVRIGYMLGGKKLKQYANDSIKADIEFTLIDQQPLLTFDNELETYNDKLILLDPNYQATSGESYSTELDSVVGDGYGKHYYTKNEFNTYKKTYVWKAFDRVGIRKLRLFLNTVKGKKKSFYVPTNRNDFNVISDVLSAHTYITVEDFGIDLSKTIPNKHFCIRKKDGSVYCAQVISVTRSSGGIALNISGTVGENIVTSDIMSLSMLELMRLTTDRVSISYDGIDYAQCKMPLQSVTDEDYV